MKVLCWLVILGTPLALAGAGFLYREQVEDFLSRHELLAPDDGLRDESAFGSEADPSPVSTQRGPAASGPVPEVPKMSAGEIARRYPDPEIPSLADLVGDWTRLPAEVYPDEVILARGVEVDFVSGGTVIGRSSVPAGTSLYPLRIDGDSLVVTREKGVSKTEVTVPVDATDLKDQVRKKYDTWREAQVAGVRRQREAARRMEATLKRVGRANLAAVGPEPERNADGSVAVMIESIRRGEVKEIKPANIGAWRWIGLEEHEGEPYWAGVVAYQAETRWGIINTEGKALIRNGRVVRWIYAYSGDPIR